MTEPRRQIVPIAEVRPPRVAVGCTLTIEAGIQAGATLALSPGVHHVGASLDDDVVVVDAALGARHFTVEHHGATTLRTQAAALRLDGGSELAAGSSLRVDGSLRFRVGQTSFRLDAAPAPHARTRRLAAPFFGVVSCIAATLVMSTPGAESNATLGLPLPDHVFAVAAATPSTAEVAAALGDRLAAGGLSGLQPASIADGTVEVSGTVSPGQRPGWAEARRWFDATYGGRVILVDRVGAAAASPLSIAAVRPGSDAPFVIDQSGRRLFVGSEVADGWVVASIEATRVMVRRDAQTLAVRF